MARTKTNTRDDTKTLTTSWRNRHLENIYLCFSDFSFFIFFFIDNFLKKFSKKCWVTALVRSTLLTTFVLFVFNLKRQTASSHAQAVRDNWSRVSAMSSINHHKDSLKLLVRLKPLTLGLLYNINWRDVQIKNAAKNVDMSCLRAPWQNGPYKN